MSSQASPGFTGRAATAPARTTRGGRLARWRPSVAVGAIAAGLVLSWLAAGGIILAGGGGDAPAGIRALALVASDAVIVAVVVLFARRGAEPLTATTLGVRRTRLWPAVGWAIAIYVGVIAAEGLWALIVALLGGVGPTRHAGATHLPIATALLVLLGAAVTAPVAEELSFRGYLFPALSRWRGPWIAAVVTAVLFGAAHALVYPPLLLPMAAAFAFGACVLYWFTGSLLPGVALHSLNNALVVAVAIGWDWQIPLAVIGCVAVAVGVLLPLAREPAPTRSPLARHPSPISETANRRGRATASLVLGIIALLALLITPFLAWIFAAFAVTFGATARSEARRQGRSDGRAAAGIVLGITAILLGVAALWAVAALS